MGRRSDHTRIELEELFVAEGRRQLAETGLARFSAREVAKRVGYSIGTLYNVFGSYDGLMLALNARTLALWAEHLRDRLAAAGDDRIRALVCGYFEFARDNPKAWIAIYEHHMADGGPAPDSYQALAADLMSVAAAEVARKLPEAGPRRCWPSPARWWPRCTATAPSPSTAPSACWARPRPPTPPWPACARRWRRRAWRNPAARQLECAAPVRGGREAPYEGFKLSGWGEAVR